MKNFARTVASIALKFTLFWTVITASLVATAGTPTTIKQSLSDSNIYDSLVGNILESATASQGGEQPGPQAEILGQAPIQQAAAAALPPDTLKSSTESVIDGIYAWLNGEVATPDFKIDLTDAKARFIAAAGQAAETHVAGLPVCTAQDLAAVQPDTDPFELNCRPPFVTAASAREQVERELSNNEDFLKDPVISADTLKNDKGESVFATAEAAPDNFQRLKQLPLLLLGVSALLGAAVFFLSENYRRGLRSLGMTLAGTGVVLLLSVWLIGFVFDRLAQPNGPLARSVGDNSLQASALALFRALSNHFNQTVLWYSLAYVILGAGALLALKFVWKQPATATVAAKAKK